MPSLLRYNLLSRLHLHSAFALGSFASNTNTEPYIDLCRTNITQIR